MTPRQTRDARAGIANAEMYVREGKLGRALRCFDQTGDRLDRVVEGLRDDLWIELRDYILSAVNALKEEGVLLCSRCRGRGIVDDPGKEPLRFGGGLVATFVKDCPRCNGNGHV